MAYMTTGGLDTAGELIRKEAGGANRMIYKHIPQKKRKLFAILCLKSSSGRVDSNTEQ